LLKLVPVILINAPLAAIAGANAVIVGAGINVNPASDAVPPGVVRLTAPEEPLPTLAMMEVEETTVNELTEVPPSVTTEVLLKFVPVILRSTPAAALIGAKEMMVGAGINVNPASDAVPPGVVRLTAPEEPLPTLAMMDEEETTVNELTEVPPSVTTEVLLKFVPVILRSTPAAAVVGANAVIVGAGMNINPASEAEPPGVVKLNAPEEPLPTIAIMDVEENTVNEAT
jgi:biotin-(acetyl-CoA carboxylase) ligase